VVDWLGGGPGSWVAVAAVRAEGIGGLEGVVLGACHFFIGVGVSEKVLILGEMEKCGEVFASLVVVLMAAVDVRISHAQFFISVVAVEDLI